MIKPQRGILIALFLLLVFGFAIGFFGEIKEGMRSITGLAATTSNTSLSITISSTSPVIYFVSSIADQSVTESSSTQVAFNVYVLDIDGIGTIRNSTAMNASAALSGETPRTNGSCERESNINTTAANYSCTVDIWYWDGAGDWIVNMTINDTSGALADTKNGTFVLGTTTAMVMAPTSLTWTSITTSSVNQTATDDPLTINNTANKDVAAESLKVKAIDMQGGDTVTEYMRSANFRVYNETSAEDIECIGNIMTNATALAINGTALPAGNNSNGQGNTTLYVCLFNVTSGLSPQTYSTTVSGKWTVSIS